VNDFCVDVSPSKALEKMMSDFVAQHLRVFESWPKISVSE